jgi:hypothetical protein
MVERCQSILRLDWGINVITIQGNNIIQILVVAKLLGNQTKLVMLWPFGRNNSRRGGFDICHLTQVVSIDTIVLLLDTSIVVCVRRASYKMNFWNCTINLNTSSNSRICFHEVFEPLHQEPSIVKDYPKNTIIMISVKRLWMKLLLD